MSNTEPRGIMHTFPVLEQLIVANQWALAQLHVGQIGGRGSGWRAGIMSLGATTAYSQLIVQRVNRPLAIKASGKLEHRRPDMPY